MKVTAYVYVLKDGASVLLRPGDTIPEGVEVTNPAVLDESEAPDTEGNEDTVTDEDSDADKAEDVPAEATAPAPRKRTAKKADASE